MSDSRDDSAGGLIFPVGEILSGNYEVRSLLGAGGMGQVFEALDHLLDRSTTPERVYRHDWSVGDLLIWNNTGVLHRVTPYPPGSGRPSQFRQLALLLLLQGRNQSARGDYVRMLIGVSLQQSVKVSAQFDEAGMRGG